MKKIENPTSAQTLLSLLPNGSNNSPLTTDAVAEAALVTFIADIQTLDKSHNKDKSITQDRLAEQVFRRAPTFQQERDAIPYYRYQLRSAFEELTRLEKEMRRQGDGSITADVLVSFSSIIRDYLFDLREILGFLQRKVDNWRFFEGGKNSGVSSWEVFRLAKSLAYQSTFQGTGAPFEHKTAQIASVFVLRQAMELRFERLIGVYPHDRNGKSPKLRHGFHHDFIAAHDQFFDTDDFSITKLRHLYDWCSEIVHQAYQPYAWQIAMALRRAGDLLRSRSVPSNQAWSIYNAVTIPDVETMQATYEEHFLEQYGHGQWRFTRRPPEAQLPAGYEKQVTTGSDYRTVRSQS